VTIILLNLAVYRKQEEELIVIVASQKVDRQGRKEGTILGSVRTQKLFCYTEEVDHLGNAEERSYYNHTASCTSEKYRWSLILEKRAAIKSSVCIFRYKEEPYSALKTSNLHIYGGRQLY
jgi:hypothetical protein